MAVAARCSFCGDIRETEESRRTIGRSDKIRTVPVDDVIATATDDEREA
jgi:hypothetical protein